MANEQKIVKSENEAELLRVLSQAIQALKEARDGKPVMVNVIIAEGEAAIAKVSNG